MLHAHILRICTGCTYAAVNAKHVQHVCYAYRFL